MLEKFSKWRLLVWDIAVLLKNSTVRVSKQSGDSHLEKIAFTIYLGMKNIRECMFIIEARIKNQTESGITIKIRMIAKSSELRAAVLQ